MLRTLIAIVADPQPHACASHVQKADVLTVMSEKAPPPDYRLIELLFFGYRDFVAEADRILAAYDFGRAHHRILHFVHRNPGLTVAELLRILGITKQALSRVLKDLLSDGFIAQSSGEEDRRQRLLTTTPKGATLAQALSQAQSQRLSRALQAIGPDQRALIERFLLNLVEPEEQDFVASISTDRTPEGQK
jgi:DNA-binding MarR family transcriptional regulator